MPFDQDLLGPAFMPLLVYAIAKEVVRAYPHAGPRGVAITPAAAKAGKEDAAKAKAKAAVRARMKALRDGGKRPAPTAPWSPMPPCQRLPGLLLTTSNLFYKVRAPPATF